MPPFLKETGKLRFASHRKAGFSLPEVLIVLVILGFVSAGLYAFLIDTSRILFMSTEKLEINRDIRQFTLSMSDHARSANHFFIYKSFEPGDRNDVADRGRDGTTGDFLLLIYQQPYPNFDDPEHITRLVGYFRRPDNNSSSGPVYRFDLKYSPGQYRNTQTFTPEQLIAGLAYNGSYPQIIQLSRGLANGQLFYNLFDRSIMVKAEIIHGNDAKRVTDTYNFTISPRG